MWERYRAGEIAFDGNFSAGTTTARTNEVRETDRPFVRLRLPITEALQTKRRERRGDATKSRGGDARCRRLERRRRRGGFGERAGTRLLGLIAV
jgi:hypothetical protein